MFRCKGLYQRTLNRIIIVSIIVIGLIMGSSGLHVLIGSPMYNPVEHVACTIIGGTFVIPGVPNAFVCMTPAVDEGKECTDSSQCADVCIAEIEKDVSGICTAQHDAGCSWFMENGNTHYGCILN